MTELHRPTPDVEHTYHWLLREGFDVVESRGGPGESFGNQFVCLSDGTDNVTITRDRGQWMLGLWPGSWSASKPLDLVLAVMDGSYRQPPSQVELPDQLPVGASWIEVLPNALEWASSGSHREVIAEAGGWYRSDLTLGEVPGRPNLDDIGYWLARLAGAIEAPESDLPSLGTSRDFGYPHVEKTSEGFAYVVVERGLELVRRETPDVLEILSWALKDTTSVMASAWEMQHRHPTDDVRRRMFAKQLVLLDRLHPLWARWRVKELGQRLKEAGLDPTEAHEVVAEAVA